MYACLHVPDLTPAQKRVLMRCAAEFSPILEPGPDYVVADIQGLGTLMGRPRQIADRIKGSLNTAGFHQSRVAVAANTHAATVAARGLDAPVTVIEPGDESRALGILPLSFLNPVPELLETLSAWGIHTFGDLSRLPETGLAERLGPEGVRLYLLARGCSPAPLVPESEAPDFSASIELDHPLDSLEPLAFLFGRLLNDICGRLVSHGLAATEVRSILGLENNTEYERIIRLPYATTDNATLLKLLQYDLSAHPPQTAIVKVTLIAQPSPQRRVQGGLFIPVAPEAEKLELTLARLAAVVGEVNVGSPELFNTHRADAFRMNHFVVNPDNLSTRLPLSVTVPPLAIRLYRPPIPADVLAPLGYPQRIMTAKGIIGNVIGYAGPWRTSGEWWRDESWARDEWDVALHTGALYRISREIYTGPGKLKSPELPLPDPGRYSQPAPPPEVTAPGFSVARPWVAPSSQPLSQQQTTSTYIPAKKQDDVTTRWFINGNYD